MLTQIGVLFLLIYNVLSAWPPGGKLYTIFDISLAQTSGSQLLTVSILSLLSNLFTVWAVSFESSRITGKCFIAPAELSIGSCVAQGLYAGCNTLTSHLNFVNNTSKFISLGMFFIFSINKIYSKEIIEAEKETAKQLLPTLEVFSSFSRTDFLHISEAKLLRNRCKLIILHISMLRNIKSRTDALAIRKVISNEKFCS